MDEQSHHDVLWSFDYRLSVLGYIRVVSHFRRSFRTYRLYELRIG